MAYAYKNLKTPTNTDPGLADFALIAPVSAFVDPDGIKVPVAPFSNPGDEVIIKTAHEFVDANGGFAKFLLAPEKNQLDANVIGDKGFQKFAAEATIFVPGSYAQVHEVMKNLLNTPLIVLLPDANCGTNMYYQLGTSCVFAYASPSFKSGTTADGVKGYEVKIESKSPAIFLYQPPTPVKVLPDVVEPAP